MVKKYHKTHKTAGAVLLNSRNDKIFLIYKKSRKEYLLPKGHIEKGETPLETAKREVFEETGYKNFVILGKPLTKYSFEFNEEGKTSKKVIYVYLAILLDTLRENRTAWMVAEGLAGKWVDIDEALEKVKYDDIKKAIKLAKNKAAKYVRKNQ